MFDILVYVFENWRQPDVSRDPERVAKRLSAAGFDDAEISAALSWLAGVGRDDVGPRAAASIPKESVAGFELDATTADCRTGFRKIGPVGFDRLFALGFAAIAVLILTSGVGGAIVRLAVLFRFAGL